jgi:hypothetical protein
VSLGVCGSPLKDFSVSRSALPLPLAPARTNMLDQDSSVSRSALPLTLPLAPAQRNMLDQDLSVSRSALPLAPAPTKMLDKVALSINASTIRGWVVRDEVWSIDGVGGHGAGEKQLLLKNELASGWS